MGKSSKSARTAGILCIGTELTEGHIQDKNGKDLSQLLTQLGFLVVSIRFIPDCDYISGEIKALSEAVDLLVITGGLGPTSDDMTREAVAEAAGVTLKYEKALWDKILTLYGKKISPTNQKQAWIPEGFSILSNPVGSACGFNGMIGNCFTLSLPGPPDEIASMVNQISEAVCVQFNLNQLQKKVKALTVWFISESLLEEKLQQWSLNYRVEWGTRTAPARVIVYIRGNESEMIEAFCSFLINQLGSFLVSDGEMSPVDELLLVLKRNHLTLAGAESCTGGMISSLLVEQPGASASFLGSAVTYSNQIKEKLLSVSAQTLKNEGAVSNSTVFEMVSGVLAQFGSDVAYAVSGIAGPSGGDTAKPVGTVFIGVGNVSQKVVKRFFFRGNRQMIRKNSSAAALFLLLKFISTPDAIDIEANWEYSYCK